MVIFRAEVEDVVHNFLGKKNINSTEQKIPGFRFGPPLGLKRFLSAAGKLRRRPEVSSREAWSWKVVNWDFAQTSCASYWVTRWGGLWPLPRLWWMVGCGCGGWLVSWMVVVG